MFTFKQLCERSEATLRHYLGKPILITQQQDIRQINQQTQLQSQQHQQQSNSGCKSEMVPFKVEDNEVQTNDYESLVQMSMMDSFGLDDDDLDEEEDELDIKTEILLNGN